MIRRNLGSLVKKFRINLVIVNYVRYINDLEEGKNIC